jgi:hypothetical protein
VAANAENALAAVGIADSQNRVAVRPRAVVDQVNEGPCLKIGELPTHKFPDLIAAAFGGAGTAVQVGAVHHRAAQPPKPIRSTSLTGGSCSTLSKRSFSLAFREWR